MVDETTPRRILDGPRSHRVSLLWCPHLVFVKEMQFANLRALLRPDFQEIRKVNKEERPIAPHPVAAQESEPLEVRISKVSRVLGRACGAWQAPQAPQAPKPKKARGLDKDRKSTRLNSSHSGESRMPSSA